MDTLVVYDYYQHTIGISEDVYALLFGLVLILSLFAVAKLIEAFK